MLRCARLLVGAALACIACEPREPSAALTHSGGQEPLRLATTSVAERHGEGRPVAAPDVDSIPRIESYRLKLGFRQPAEQLIACGPLGFARLRQRGFDGWAYQPLREVWRHEQATFTHVVKQHGHSYLLLGPGGSLLYYQPNTHLTPHGRVPSLGPFEVWPDPRRREWLWVHYLKDDAVHWFQLMPVSHEAQLQSTVSLPGFAGRTPIRLNAGNWLYSAKASGTEPGVKSWLSVWGEQVTQVSAIPAQVVSLSPASRSDRVWAITENDGVQLMDLRATEGLLASVKLRGSPYALDQEGRRLAVVTQQRESGERTWAVEVADEGERSFYFKLPARHTAEADALAAETSDRDVCLVPGRPWVIVGGRGSLFVVDYVKGHVVLSRTL